VSQEAQLKVETPDVNEHRPPHEPLTHPVHHRAEVALGHDVQQLPVRVAAARVQVLPDGAAEQEGVLRDDGQPGPADGTAHTHTQKGVRPNSSVKVWIKLD